ncbi:MAG: VWA domain-containing protein, partial [Pseudomonadota bacterium]|nr:VWA domain-containing protein [Pseudomonadota bacterium]
MFNSFFYELKRAQVPVSLREYLTLLEAVEAGLANYAIEDFYYLSRSALVKDERHIDRFDQVFGHVFKGLEYLSDIFKDVFGEELPEEWLRQMAELHLSEEER